MAQRCLTQSVLFGLKHEDPLVRRMAEIADSALNKFDKLNDQLKLENQKRIDAVKQLKAAQTAHKQILSRYEKLVSTKEQIEKAMDTELKHQTRQK